MTPTPTTGSAQQHVRRARRLVLTGSSTVAALVLLLGYHTSLAGPAQATTSSSAFSASGSRTPPGGGSGGTSSTEPSARQARQAPRAARAASQKSTVTGTPAPTPYGPVQVTVSVTSGTVSDVRVLQYPWSDGQSQQISSDALPRLVQETVDAHLTSASDLSKVDMVSGASFTSQGYLTSLQSALDQAGL